MRKQEAVKEESEECSQRITHLLLLPRANKEVAFLTSSEERLLVSLSVIPPAVKNTPITSGFIILLLILFRQN